MHESRSSQAAQETYLAGMAKVGLVTDASSLIAAHSARHHDAARRAGSPTV